MQLPIAPSSLLILLCRDLERIESPVYSAKAHDQIINCLDGVGGLGVGGGAPELATGSRDGKSPDLSVCEKSNRLIYTPIQQVV